MGDYLEKALWADVLLSLIVGGGVVASRYVCLVVVGEHALIGRIGVIA